MDALRRNLSWRNFSITSFTASGFSMEDKCPILI